MRNSGYTATYTTGGNQLATSSLASGLTYDAAGDITYDGNNAYLYDAEGRICASENGSGTMTGYIYDGAGIRVAKASLTSFSCAFASNGYHVTSSYVLDSNNEQVTEYSVSGTTQTWVHTNAFAGGKLLASYHDTDTYFALEDWLGTKRMEITPDGLTATFRSLPYGNGYVASGTAVDATEQHFTGKERDLETGDDYFEARYYSSNLGRFMSPDWSAKEEPVPYVKLDDPQTLNLYGYVDNNPLTRFDLDGHAYICITCVAQAVKTTIADHPRTVGVLKGLGTAALGVAIVAASVGGEAGSGGLATPIAAVGVMSGTSMFVKGTIQVLGAATGTDVKPAEKVLDATRNPAGLITTIATGGNLEAGEKAATILDAATAVHDGAEVGGAALRGDTHPFSDAVKVQGMAQAAADTHKTFSEKKEDKK